MHRGLRWAAYVVGGVAIIGVTGFSAAVGVSGSKLKQTYDVALTTVAVPTDAESLAWGSHLVNSVTGCQDCHGPDLSGTQLVDDAVALLAAPNLTSGRGGLGADFTDADWVRAIRHGVRRDGTSLIIMPSSAYATLSDADLGAMIAYLRQLPPVDNELPRMRLRPLGRVLIATGALDDEIVAKKTPRRERYDTVERGVTLEYGRYLANIAGCTSCHRPDLQGGPSGAPGAPPAANITPAALPSWTQEDFFRVMRQGRRPDGTSVSEYMPWRVMGRMTDDELSAIWLYVREGTAQ